MAKRTIYQRIMQAAEKGTGLRLSADDVARLSSDSAIWMAAKNDDALEDGGRCITCQHYAMGNKAGWHCTHYRERPDRCREWQEHPPAPVREEQEEEVGL